MSSPILDHYRLMADTLDSLHVAVCLFGDDDRALLWNSTFLRLFPEHAGHVTVGEHYGVNLRRFYATRLSPAEMGSIDQCIAEGIARHRAQTQPFIFVHHGQWVRVTAETVPGIGRLRIWTPIAPPNPGSGLSVGPSGTLLREVMPFAELDGDGATVMDDAGRIAWVNPRFVQLFGLAAPAQASGRTLAEVVATAWSRLPDGTARAAPWLQTLAEGERFSGAPFELALPGDRWLRVLQQRSPDGQVFTTYGDISATKRLQRELGAAREAAEAASKAKDGFLATVSHELRTPMNGILGMLDILDDGRLAADQTERLGLARQSAEALLGLLDDILAFSRLESGHGSIESVPGQPAVIVGDVCRLLLPRATDKRLVLRWTVEPDVPAAVLCDPARLRQILFNLVGNAVKFTERGTVEVTVRRRAHPVAGSLLEFVVGDTGIGVAPAALGSIFDPFVQADSGIARRFGGTGLGLAICRSLVEAMGGTIGVESREGQGTTFRFSIPALPCAAPAAAPVAAPRAAAPATAARRVLVVDDHPTNREVARLYLQRLGLQASTAPSGAAAVQACRDPFDLILMDLEMPGMDGFAAAQAIRASGLPGAAAPIIALTAHVGAAHRLRCREAGMQGFVSKPIRAAQLAEAIAEALAAPADPAAATAPAAAETLLDENASLLASQLPAADWAELLGEFSNQVKADLAELAAAARSGDPHRKVAHRLKGAAWNLGAKRLGDVAATLEPIPSPDLPRRLPELDRVAQATLEAMGRLP